jgi:signal peptidase I
MSQPNPGPEKLSALTFKARKPLLNVLRSGKIKKKHKEANWLSDALRLIIAVLILVFAVRTFLIQVCYIPTSSMEKTLSAGDVIMVNKISYGITNPFWGASDTEKLLSVLPNPFYKKRMPISNIRYIVRFSFKPKRMDIVTIRPTSKTGEITKRIIGLPGEQIKIVNGIVYVNGKQIREDRSAVIDRSNFKQIKIPAGSYFVLGDNRARSSDSRDWGVVSRDNIIGVLAARIWPQNKIRTFK